MAWLVATVEDLIQGICEISRVGSKAFITQRRLNNHGRLSSHKDVRTIMAVFLAIAIYDGSSQRSFVAISEGREG